MNLKKTISVLVLTFFLISGIFCKKSPTDSQNDENGTIEDWNQELIAFSSDRSGGNDIYVMKTNGSRQTRVTTNNETDYWPSWSPNGTRLTI